VALTVTWYQRTAEIGEQSSAKQGWKPRGGTAGDRPPTFRVGDIAIYIPPAIPEVSGDVVVTRGRYVGGKPCIGLVD